MQERLAQDLSMQPTGEAESRLTPEAQKMYEHIEKLQQQWLWHRIGKMERAEVEAAFQEKALRTPLDIPYHLRTGATIDEIRDFLLTEAIVASDKKRGDQKESQWFRAVFPHHEDGSILPAYQRILALFDEHPEESVQALDGLYQESITTH